MIGNDDFTMKITDHLPETSDHDGKVVSAQHCSALHLSGVVVWGKAVVRRGRRQEESNLFVMVVVDDDRDSRRT